MPDDTCYSWLKIASLKTPHSHSGRDHSLPLLSADSRRSPFSQNLRTYFFSLAQARENTQRTARAIERWPYRSPAIPIRTRDRPTLMPKPPRRKGREDFSSLDSRRTSYLPFGLAGGSVSPRSSFSASPAPILRHYRETAQPSSAPTPLLNDRSAPPPRTETPMHQQPSFTPILHLRADCMHVSSRTSSRCIRVFQRLCIWLAVPLHCSRELAQDVEVARYLVQKGKGTAIRHL